MWFRWEEEGGEIRDGGKGGREVLEKPGGTWELERGRLGGRLGEGLRRLKKRDGVGGRGGWEDVSSR